MGQFRVIAVRPLKGCDKKYFRILKEDKFYLFYNDYEAHGNTIRKKKVPYVLVPKDFYKIGSNKLHLSVSAIIGKNGDGKSTIVELIIRILNNFACFLDFQSSHDGLKPVKGLHAELYYEVEGKLIVVRIQEANFDWILIDNSEYKDLYKIKAERMSNIEKYFFYTQISNYSLYAYNSNEYVNESDIGDGDWLSGIFHKNDGYQTPVVLNPMRTEGNIEINRENGLIKDRLISLFLTTDITKDSFRWINEKQCSQYFDIELDSENSKLTKKTFQDFFINYRKPDRRDYIRNNNNTFHSGIVRETDDLMKALSLTQEHEKETGEKILIPEATLIESTKSLESIKRIKSFFDEKNGNSYLNKSKEILDKLELSQSTISYYLNSLNTLCNIILNQDSKQQQTKEIKKEIDNLNSISQYTYIQLQRVITAVLCKEIWVEKLKKENIVIKTSTNITIQLLDYLVYKTLSIASKYPNYDKYRIDLFTEFDWNEFDKKLLVLETTLWEVIDKIFDDKHSHITLKARQAINFFNHPYSDIKENKCFVGITNYCNTVCSYYKYDKKEINLYEYFFPPIFKSDVIIRQVDRYEKFEKSEPVAGELYPEINLEEDNITSLSLLSSGERQQLNVVSTVIYHLRNLNSVSEKEHVLVKYKYINLIFEEIELYFHPEFQRTFMSFLLYHLSKADLGKIEDINLCFVTHSPFILSDIPKQNILALNKGEQVEIPFGTLGANIHEMLGHSFLLKNTIGEIVKIKVDYFVKVYNDYCQHKDKKTKYNYSTFVNEKDEFEFLIENLGEGYLKNILKSYYSEILQDAKDKGKIVSNKEEIEEQIKNKKQEIEKLIREKNKL